MKEPNDHIPDDSYDYEQWLNKHERMREEQEERRLEELLMDRIETIQAKGRV